MVTPMCLINIIFIVIGTGFAMWWGTGWVCLLYMGFREDYLNYWRIKNGNRKHLKTVRRNSTQS